MTAPSSAAPRASSRASATWTPRLPPPLRRHQAGDWAAAAREQDRLADVFEIVYAPNGRVSGGAAGLGAFKTALQVMGVIESNTMSAPMLSLNDDEAKAIKIILERNGLV